VERRDICARHFSDIEKDRAMSAYECEADVDDRAFDIAF
jgi:hypothetical protein